MEPRKDDVRSAAQSSIRGSSSSACTSYPIPEYPVAGTVKPVLNYSIQTGEEFSLEFMRAIPKKHPVPGMPHNQNVTSSAGHKDSRVSLGAHRTGGETRFDASIFLTSDNHLPDEVERKPFSENENTRRHMSSTSVPRVPSGGGSSQGLSRGYASSEASETSRMIKILCSFGGKILPRPSDGKLRYVGGETRIIRISRNVSWQELKQKTTAIYNQPHAIKYQLPGEDLDALISVSNDEDLRNMMEECGLLDGDGSQKLRIFLVSSIEFDDMSFSLGSMDSDSGIQYVAAINGMDGIAVNSSSGQGLVNTSMNEPDQFINLNFDSRDGSNLHAVNASTFMPPEMLSRPMPSALYSDNTANLRSYYSHGVQNLQGSDYSNPATSERFHDSEGQRMQNLQGSDYSNPATIERFHDIEGQFYQDAQTEASVKEEKRFSGAPPAAGIQEGVTSSLQPSGSGKSLETCSMPRARSTTQGSDISEDDRHFGGAFASGCSDIQADMIDHSYKNPSPHPGRVFHSEWIPREQTGFLNRLSKSEDSLNPELLIRQSQSGVASEHIAENIDSAEGTEKPNLAAQAINLNDPAVDDSLIQFEKGFTNTVHQASPFSEHLLGEKRSSDDTSNRNVEKVSHAAEQVAAKGKLDEESSQDVETTNQLGSHAAVPHHISWDAPKPTLPTDCEYDPVVPCSTSSVDVSHKETIIPSTQNRDIAGSTERTSPDILSDFFANANSSAQSSSPFIDPIHSLNMPNYEPQRWSFFRNLAQNEFPKKDEAQDLAKIEEGVYPLEHDTTNVKNLAPQSDAPVEVPPVASRTNVDPSISLPGFVSSQIDNPTTTKNVEGFQVDNPFTNMHEMMPSHLDFEEQKTEEGRAVGPVMDASFKDNDFEYLQIIKNEDLEELRELGSGTFGTVYHGKWRGSDVAIKRIKKSCFTGRSSELERLAHEFWREAEILSKLHHPNVVAFYGVVKDGPGGTLATVTEFMVNGSLRHVLQRKDKYLDRRKRLIIAMDAAFGLEYLHSKNIVHFDLKCDNLLVNLKDQSRPICKVGDFGLSKIKRNTLVSGGVRGTLPWMAPELLNGSSNKVSEKVDVFSFGIVMWEILTGEEPYANMHYGAIIGGIVNNTLRPPVPASCDPEWRRLMEQCWAPDPAQRPAFTEIAGRLRSMSVAANQAKATK
ncbi:uncharacterized protein [Miscanthus floridulus]|uniref:uncharacterized protein isoform X4 n=1 Tax=Miscanthus floridulus TaxID=154761 RepID=UPI0034594DC1